MHADGVRSGGRYAWAVYFAPEPELLKRFEDAAAESEPDWESLEPEFA